MSDSARGRIPSSELRQLVSYSLMSGLCPLIPVPLLDDWARDLLRTRLVTRLAAGSGATLSDAEAKLLACGYDPATAGGCVAGCLKAALIQPIVFLSHLIFRKVVRKVLVFLLAKDVVDTFSETFHEAYLLRHALALGAVPPGDAAASPSPSRPFDPKLIAVRGAVESVYRAADTRPVTSLARSLFGGSRRLLLRTARRMTRLLRQGRRMLRRGRRGDEEKISERLEREGEASLGGLIDELTADLEQQGGYLEGLERRLEERLAARPSAAYPHP